MAEFKNLDIVYIPEEHEDEDASQDVESIVQSELHRFAAHNNGNLGMLEDTLTDLLKYFENKYDFIIDYVRPKFILDRLINHRTRFLSMFDLHEVYKVKKFLNKNFVKELSKYQQIPADEVTWALRNIEYLKQNLIPKIDLLISTLQDRYTKEFNLNIDYFLFLKLDNPMVWATAARVKPTPGTFKLFQVISESKSKELISDFSQSFAENVTHFRPAGRNRDP